MSNDILNPTAAHTAPTETIFEVIAVADPATGGNEIIEALIEPASGAEVIEVFHTTPEGVTGEIVEIAPGPHEVADMPHDLAPGMGPGVEPVDPSHHAGESAAHDSGGTAAGHDGDHASHDATGDSTSHAETHDTSQN